MSFFELEAQEVRVPLTQAAAEDNEENLEDEVECEQEEEEDNQSSSDDEEVPIGKKRQNPGGEKQGKEKQQRVEQKPKKEWEILDDNVDLHTIWIVSETEKTFTLNNGKTVKKMKDKTAEETVQGFIDSGLDIQLLP